MWEHVDRLDDTQVVVLAEYLQIACLCSGVAADVDDALGLGSEDGLHHVGMHAGARRVGDDDVGPPMLLEEVVVEDVLHVACEEERVVNAVDLRVHLRILDGFRHVLDADDLTGLAGHEVGDGARAGVEVVDERQCPSFCPRGGFITFLPCYICSPLGG